MFAAALDDPARLAIVDELTLGMPTSPVAHHVKVLQDAGLLVRTRSEGDRRRTALRLNNARRVVFVCTHNSARPQLAAALWRDRIGGAVTSTGTLPAHRVHPRAVRVAHEHGLALDPASTNHDDDLIIAVCDNAHEELPGPARADTDDAFEAACTDLADLLPAT